MIAHQLPPGWEWKRLGDICEEDKVIVDGRSSDLPFLGLEMVETETGEIDWEARTTEGTSTCYYFDKRHILYGKLRPYLNKVALPDVQGRCSTELVPLFPKDKNSREFIAYLLRRNETIDYVMAEKTGSRMSRANVGYLLSLKVPVPSPDEQRRIVTRINAKLAVVEKARKAAAEQEILSQNLFSSLLQKCFSDNDWEKVKLGRFCDFEGGSQPPKSVFSYSPKLGYTRLVQIQDFRLDNAAVYIPTDQVRRTFTKEDVMIGRYGPPVFQILRGLEGAYNVALMKAVPLDEQTLDNDFLYYLLQERTIQDEVIEQSQRSAGQSGVDKDFLKSRIVKIPNISIQKKIAKELSEKQESCKKVIVKVKEQSKYISVLPSVILRKAFRGEL
jgi:type I restriction enzyme S subunit